LSPAWRQLCQKPGDPRAIPRGVVGIDQRAPVRTDFEAVGGQRRRDFLERFGKVDRHLLLPEAVHQPGLLLDQQDAALVDDGDAVRHRLGFLDVVGREDDRGPGFLQGADRLPHVLAQLDIDTGGGLVEEQHLRLVAERLGDQDAAFHAAGQLHDLGVRACPRATGGAARPPDRRRPARSRTARARNAPC
jgi:hypothetical protein